MSVLFSNPEPSAEMVIFAISFLLVLNRRCRVQRF